MRRYEARQKRKRDQLCPALNALVRLIPQNSDPRTYLESHFCTFRNPDENTAKEADTFIDGEGLQRLLVAIKGYCPDGVKDLLRITRRAPGSQSTMEKVFIGELCFAICQATRPLSIHQRRGSVEVNTDWVTEEIPLLQYYKGKRFDAIVQNSNAILHSLGNFTLEVGRSIEPEAWSETDSSAVFPFQKTLDSTQFVSHSASEWEKYISAMQTPLPMSLRVHQNEKVLRWVALNFLTDINSPAKGVVAPVKVLAESTEMFSCSNDAYHSQPLTKYICRTLHAAGAASFQEVVSAIPVIVLGVQSHHSVLELCAAPGSKTLQTLDETLKRGWSVDIENSLVIANEKDRTKATQILPTRLKRYHAPNVLCTRCDATQWPRLYCKQKDCWNPVSAANPGVTLVEKQFDRIICDVPCSGDGTLRKDRSLAATWSPDYVKSLVTTQKALLRRGLEMLSTNGILVYSTCSINPKEDEEVVCFALQFFREAVELVDVNEVLHEQGVHLHSQGGLSCTDLESLGESEVPSNYSGAKVLRVLPHRDDTGGFFVAAFRKIKPSVYAQMKIMPQKLNEWTRGKLWAPVGKDDPVWVNIAKFYSFERDFFRYYTGSHEFEKSITNITTTVVAKADDAEPELMDKRRARLVPVYHLNPFGEQTRRIVLTTSALANILFNTRPFKGPGVELVSVGVRAFEAYDRNFLHNADCRWRAVVESASYLAPLFSSRKLLFTAHTHRGLLEELFRNGFIYVRDYWWLLLCDESVNVANISEENIFPLVKPGPLEEMLRVAKSCSKPELDTFTSTVRDLLATEIRTGGVLVGVCSQPSDLRQLEPWFLSATLSGNKLELAIDTSLRGFALMAFMNNFDGLSFRKEG